MVSTQQKHTTRIGETWYCQRAVRERCFPPGTSLRADVKRSGEGRRKKEKEVRVRVSESEIESERERVRKRESERVRE